LTRPGTTDRLPVRRLAFDLASPAGDRAPPALATPAATADCLQPREPDQATARPIGSRCAVPPSTWPTCRRSPPGTARHWRRRRFVAGFTDRENEGPTELPVIEHCQHGPRQRQPRIACTPRACPRHGNPDRQPVRCLAFDLAHLPAIATKHRSTLAPSSLRGRLHRSRGRKPDRTADDRALPARTTPAATLAHVCNRCLQAPREPAHATATPIGSRYAVSPRPGPLAGDRHPAPLDTGAVVASWPASPIERTKARPNCRWSSAASTGHASGNRGLPAPREPDHATATPIGSRYAVSPSTWPTCRRSPPGTARPWRRRRLVAGFTDREDERPTEPPVIERCQHGPRQRQPRIARTPRA
jgi:hypothetical protein